METVKLCTRLTVSRILDHAPTRIELVVCLEDQIEPSQGWFLSPSEFKTKLAEHVFKLNDDYFFSKNHLKLAELLRKDFAPHKIQRIEINLMDQKSIYEA